MQTTIIILQSEPGDLNEITGILKHLMCSNHFHLPDSPLCDGRVFAKPVKHNQHIFSKEQIF